MEAQKEKVERNKRVVDSFLNLESQRSISRKENISPSRVNELLIKILGRTEINKIKLKKRKINAEKYKQIYLGNK